MSRGLCRRPRQPVTGGRENAPGVNSSLDQPADVLAGFDRRPCPEQREDAAGVPGQRFIKNVDSFLDNAGHRDRGRPAEFGQVVDDGQGVAGDEDEAGPEAHHRGEGLVEDGGAGGDVRKVVISCPAVGPGIDVDEMDPPVHEGVAQPILEVGAYG